MSMVPPPTPSRQGRPQPLCLVATRATKRTADKMMDSARTMGGAEAVARHLRAVDPAQLPALIGLLLNTRPRPKRIPFTLSTEAMRRGYSQYRQGVRNDFTITAMREYTRANKQAERARKAS